MCSQAIVSTVAHNRERLVTENWTERLEASVLLKTYDVNSLQLPNAQYSDLFEYPWVSLSVRERRIPTSDLLFLCVFAGRTY